MDCYQITSKDQKKIVSEIVQGQHDIQPKRRTPTSTVVGDAAETKVVEDCKPKVENNAQTHVIKGKCYAKNEEDSKKYKDSVGCMIEQVMKSLVKGTKAKIKIEIEISKD